ncbi:MAG TPA: PQQ-dependent sugar dehydrogenase [Flavipsychrobacter sp.]|nr:PQQ-dependent sugar dehydrogenase [Flavipsychrobacter sp.]
MNRTIRLSPCWMGICLMALSACNNDDDNNVRPQTDPGADWAMASISAHTISIKVDDLPAPDTNASVTNFPQILMSRPVTAKFYAPAGFVINLYEEDIPGARTLCVAPNGDVFVAVSSSNRIVVLRDLNNDGHADTTFTWDEGGQLNRPYGLAFYQNRLYVANSGAVVRYEYFVGQTKANGNPSTLATYPGGGQHAYRSIALDTVNGKMYIGVGSTMNVGFEDDPRYATIQRFNLNGSGGETYTSGIRNPQALAINYALANPTLWSAVNERDGLGDELVPDYLTEIASPGLFYGWPYVYLRSDKPDPRIQGSDPRIATTKTPEVLLEAHSAALGLLFYTGTQFPAEYRGNAFVAMHGSWNRANASGYKIVRVKLDATGHATGGYEDFLKGWRLNEGSADRPEVFGRPVSMVMAKDGSMLISDDAGGAIWRLRWKGNP